MFKHQLGCEARDIVTGLEGVITSRTEYLNGCVRYCIQPRAVDNKPAHEVEWVDEQQIEVIGDGVRTRLLPAQVAGPVAAVGGPRRNPPRQ